jgi:hypothetical protein
MEAVAIPQKAQRKAAPVTHSKQQLRKEDGAERLTPKTSSSLKSPTAARNIHSRKEAGAGRHPQQNQEVAPTKITIGPQLQQKKISASSQER